MHTPEAIEKIRQASTGQIHTFETRRKISQSKMGNQNARGKKRSPESIDKMRRAATEAHALKAAEDMRFGERMPWPS